ncbi:MAG TPA: hypothetical protein VKU84_13885 [Stellaceae bacterium]|nr:hypothetical protein [Stellaceae bacterium]
MIARMLLARRPAPRAFFCERDEWSFDPRYTCGRCPICGWAPASAPAAPRWLELANRVDWELFGLFALADLLVVLGLIVAEAAGLLHGAGRP